MLHEFHASRLSEKIDRYARLDEWLSHDPFKAVITGSSPVPSTKYTVSSTGRAPFLQIGGWGFKSLTVYHYICGSGVIGSIAVSKTVDKGSIPLVRAKLKEELNMSFVIVALSILGFLSVITVYSACVVSSRISREEEMQELQDKLKQEH